MSNRTDPSAKQVHGMNPQFLLETILRNKIYNTLYWKEKCFALTSETIIDRAINIKYIGGNYGSTKYPSDFICLVLKMLQIQPSDEIIEEYLSDDIAEYKYLRALTAFYVRLTARSPNVYKKLEPLYNDYRKLRVRNPDGSFSIIHMDEFIECLLNSESLFELTLPPLTKRRILEQNGELQHRVSLLEADLDLDELINNKRNDFIREYGNNQITDQMQAGDDDYLNDLNIDNLVPDDDDKNNSESSPESEEEDYQKINKKRRIEEPVQIFPTQIEEESIDDKLKKLDPNSAEYWILMRQKIGLK